MEKAKLVKGNDDDDDDWSILVITNVVCVNGLGLTILCKYKYHNEIYLDFV
jgi:hypothetical protein